MNGLTKGRTLDEVSTLAKTVCDICEDCRDEVDAVTIMLREELKTCDSVEYECGLAYKAIEEILTEQRTDAPDDTFRNAFQNRREV